MFKFTFSLHRQVHLNKIQFPTLHQRPTAFTSQTELVAEFPSSRQSCPTEVLPSFYLRTLHQLNFLCSCRFPRAQRQQAQLRLPTTSECGNNRHHLTTLHQVPRTHPMNRWTVGPHTKTSTACTNNSSTSYINSSLCNSISNRDHSVHRRLSRW